MPRHSISAIAILLRLLSGCAGQATPRASGPPADVAGTWHGAFYNPSGLVTNFPVKLVLQQTGTKVTGRAEPGGDLEGTVEGASFSYRLANQRGGGDLSVNGDDMKGFSSASGAQLTLKRQR